jgi:hypothetical protein
MPYHVVKVKGGFKVQKKNDKKMMSKDPMTKSKAEAQMKAINISENTRKLDDKQMEKLKEHSKLHKGGMKSKHMKNMKRFMETKNEKGKFHSFSEAHKKAVKIDKK